jgi:thioredoxin 1
MKKIIHFTADWCAPCKKLKPIIEEFVSNNSDIEYVLVDVDIDFHRAEEYNVMSVPTLVIFTNGEITARHTGIADYKKIEELVNS